MDLSTVASLSTALAVVVAIVLGILQVRQQERKRKEQLALEALKAAQATGMAAAIMDVLAFPDGMTNDELRQRGPHAVEAVMQFAYLLESMGWMVHRRMVDLHDIDDLMGGMVRGGWRKLKAIAPAWRKESGNQNYFEWLQWLAERMDEDPSPGKDVGAHVTHAGWRR